MAEQQSGLRFDIYERVHLSEGVAGIKELEDVELVPHIQVIPQGDQALLRGNLLLSGSYIDEQDAVNRTLEHLIPVEITLPMNRVQRMEDIAVEIENFDVDLLSTRSLNITGVLSLNGLEVASGTAGVGWSEPEEEMVFIHEAPDPRIPGPGFAESRFPEPSFADPNFADPRFADPRFAEPNQGGWINQGQMGFEPQEHVPPFTQYPPQNHFAPQPYHQPNSGQQEWSNPSLAYAAAHPIQEPEAREEEREDRQSLSLESGVFPVQEVESGEEEPAVEAGVADFSKPTAAGEANEPQISEDKKELKIAFSGKKDQEDAAQEKPFGLTTLLQNAVASKNEMRPPDKQNEAAQPSAGPSGKLEWKKLLLSSMHEKNEFRRVRLCIVQKEETLESIAKRYDLNPREIALFNRLGDTDLTEGQVVYIPK